MKKFMVIILVVAVLLVIGGIAGNVFSRGLEVKRSIFEGLNTYRSGMMYEADAAYRQDQDALSLDELKECVEDYIAGYDEELVISDIFTFSDSDYYFSIMEKDTGMGAMELLVDPYTGFVYPEFGPNMMWNIKYGMHNNSGYGMMNRGSGMMGRSNDWYFSAVDDFEANAISEEEANQLANEYLDDYSAHDYSVSDEGHEFYGYYTFHIEASGTTVGMLSVNGLTGEVWYHDWHGTLIEVIDGH